MGSSAFGPAWSRVLVEGAAELGIAPEWILAVLALESGFNPEAKNASGARGLWQRMPRDGKAYTEKDPVQQLRDAFRFWRDMKAAFRIPAFTSRAAFYCLNLAPARLLEGRYDDETVLYRKPTAAYVQNRNLDTTGRGDIRIKDLEQGLDQAVRRCRARYDAELSAAYVANVSPAP